MSTGGERRLLGAWGEEKAAAYLRRRGYRLLDANYHSRFGEIDLVAQQGGYIIFVEVKLRNGKGPVRPMEAVTPAKQKRIIQTALCWMAQHPGPAQYRFDVVEVIAPKGRDTRLCRICHIKNAFDASEP